MSRKYTVAAATKYPAPREKSMSGSSTTDTANITIDPEYNSDSDAFNLGTVTYTNTYTKNVGTPVTEYPELTLHTRVFQGNGEPYDVLNIKDLSHDGDMGGGQYLNACVWFEVLTHKSVLDNSFVPSYFHKPSGVTYTLTDQQIQKLKTAAHDAVMACHGEDFYA